MNFLEKYREAKASFFSEPAGEYNVQSRLWELSYPTVLPEELGPEYVAQHDELTPVFLRLRRLEESLENDPEDEKSYLEALEIFTEMRMHLKKYEHLKFPGLPDSILKSLRAKYNPKKDPK